MDYDTRLRNRWDNRDQKQRYLALGRILTRAAKEDMALLHWEITKYGVIGNVADDWLSREGLAEVYRQWQEFFDRHGAGIAEQEDVVWPNGDVAKTVHIRDAAWLEDQHVVLRVRLRDRQF